MIPEITVLSHSRAQAFSLEKEKRGEGLLYVIVKHKDRKINGGF